MVCISGVHNVSNKKVEVQIPTIFYEADINEDIILSYEWCARAGVEVHPPKHGILCVRKGTEIWVDGVRTKSAEDPVTEISVIATEIPKRALDLFAGTGSVTRVLQQAGYEVVSVDNNPRYQPTICGDILEWDYRKYPTRYFDLIAASPPCTEFSQAKTVGTRKLESAIRLVHKTLEIIDYFPPPSGGSKRQDMDCCPNKTS